VTPIRLMLFYLAIASFAPALIGLRPGSWAAYYYGALLTWWLVISVAVVRWSDPAGRRIRGLATGIVPTVTPYTDAARRALAQKRLIIVARDHADFNGRIRRIQSTDHAVRVISDRRSTERRRQLEVYIPERRQAERRRHDIQSLLLTQGWAEVQLPQT
jgi:hypothetical protein